MFPSSPSFSLSLLLPPFWTGFLPFRAPYADRNEYETRKIEIEAHAHYRSAFFSLYHSSSVVVVVITFFRLVHHLFSFSGNKMLMRADRNKNTKKMNRRFQKETHSSSSCVEYCT